MNISHNNIRKYKAKALSSKNSFTTFCFTVVFLVHVFHWPARSLANFLLILQHLTAFVVKTSLLFILFLSAPSFCLSFGSRAKAVTCKHVSRKCDQVILTLNSFSVRVGLKNAQVVSIFFCLFASLLLLCNFAGQFGNLHLLCVITKKRRSNQIVLRRGNEFKRSLAAFWPSGVSV